MFIRNTLDAKIHMSWKNKIEKKIFYAKIAAYTKIEFKTKKVTWDNKRHFIMEVSIHFGKNHNYKYTHLTTESQNTWSKQKHKELKEKLIIQQ